MKGENGKYLPVHFADNEESVFNAQLYADTNIKEAKLIIGKDS